MYSCAFASFLFTCLPWDNKKNYVFVHVAQTIKGLWYVVVAGFVIVLECTFVVRPQVVWPLFVHLPTIFNKVTPNIPKLRDWFSPLVHNTVWPLWHPVQFRNRSCSSRLVWGMPPHSCMTLPLCSRAGQLWAASARHTLAHTWYPKSSTVQEVPHPSQSTPCSTYAAKPSHPRNTLLPH